MKRLFLGLLFALSLSKPHVALATDQAAAKPLIHQSKAEKPSAAYQWLENILEVSALNVDRYGARPTILARSMAIVLTGMYDAWAAYDSTAVGTRLGGKLRRPAAERTEANKSKAIAYAAYTGLLDVYPEEAAAIRERMVKMGYDPDVKSQDSSRPEGIGRIAAQAVIDYRHRDGANQLGDEVGSNGKPYSDYTFYKPQNRPDAVLNPNSWMPIPFKDTQGKIFSPGFLTAHWYRVKPFALESGKQFRPPEPPAWGSDQLIKEIQECIDANANLNLEQKAVVEFMRDGPRSTGQSGHWLRFAQDVSRRDRHDTDRDIKMFFAVANVVHDTFVASWDAKRFYDTSRPYWYVRLMNPGKKIVGWKGPGQGVGEIPAEQWRPYSPEGFVTPPFPGYVSGHATASAGAGRILELFTGSNKFGATAVRKVGELTEAEFAPSAMQAREGRPASDVGDSKEIRLALPTFSATAEMAAVSRLWGGYHIRADNEAGLVLGKQIADFSWPRYQDYFRGKATVR